MQQIKDNQLNTETIASNLSTRCKEKQMRFNYAEMILINVKANKLVSSDYHCQTI